MLENLQTQVITEGKAEAKTYDKFACFCKDMSEQTEIIEGIEKVLKEEAEKRRKSHEEFVLQLNDCYTAEKEIDFAVLELKAKEKEVASASLISLKGMVKTVRKMALMADALGLQTKH